MSGRQWWAAGGIAAFVPIVGLGTLHTPPGRAALRWAVETGARSVLQGELHIGAVEGSPLSTLRLRDVRLIDRRGETAATADLVELQHRVAALFNGEFHVKKAEAQRLQVHVPRLISVLATNTSSSAPAPRPLSVRIDDARLNAARFVFGTDRVVRDLSFVGTATISNGWIVARVRTLRGEAFGRPLEGRGYLRWTGTRFDRLEASARLGPATLSIAATETSSTEASSISGRLRWPNDAWEDLVGVPLGPADLTVSLRGPPQRRILSLAGQLTHHRIRVQARGPAAPWQIDLAMPELDPRRFDRRAPAGKLAVTAQARIEVAPREGQTQAHLRLRAKGRLQAPGGAFDVERLSWTARSVDGVLENRVRLESSVGQASGEATIRLQNGRPFIDRARGRLSVRLGALAESSSPVAGAVHATLSASGSAFHPHVSGTIAADAVRIASIKARRMAGRFRWHHNLGHDRLRVTGRGAGWTSGPIHLHRVNFDARILDGRRARLTLTATGSDPLRRLELAGSAIRVRDGVRARWSRLRVGTPTATWRVSPGRVAWTGRRLRIFAVQARSARSRLYAEGDLDVGGPLGPRSRFEVRLKRFDLRTLSGLHPLYSSASGDMNVHLAWSGRHSTFTGQVELDDVRWRRFWPSLSGSISAQARPDDLQLAVTAKGPAWGRVRLKARASRPKRPHARLPHAGPGLDALRNLDLGFDVKLGALARVAPQIGNIDGRAYGRLQLGPAGRTASFAVHAPSLGPPSGPLITNVRVMANATPRAVEGEAAAVFGDRGTMLITARLGHGLRALFPLPSLSDLRGQFRFDVDRFPLALLGLRLDPSAHREPVTGDVTVRARGGLSDRGPVFVAFARAPDLRLTNDVPPIRLATQGHLDRSTATATAAISAIDLGQHSVAVRVRTPLSLEPSPLRWNGIAERVVSVAVRSNDVAVSAIRALGLDPGRTRGRLEARLSAGPGLHTATATIAARGLRISPAMAPLDITTVLTGDDQKTALHARTILGGARLLRAEAQLPIGWTRLITADRIDPKWPVAVDVESSRFPLRLAWNDPADRRDVAGHLALQASLRGPLQQPSIHAAVDVSSLRLGPTKFDRFRLRHDSGPGVLRRTDLSIDQQEGGTLTAQMRSEDRSVTTEILARGFRLGFMSAAANLSDTGAAIDGTLAGQLRIRSGPMRQQASAPPISGQLAVDRFRVAVPGWPPIDDGQLALRFDGDMARLGVAVSSGEGRARVDLQSEQPSLASPRWTGAFSLDKVPLVRAGQIIRVDLDGQIAARRSPNSIDAEIVLHDGEIRLPDRTPRTLHDVTDQPDVAFRRGRWRALVAGRASEPPPVRYTVRLRTGRPLLVLGPPLQTTVGLDLVAKGRPRGVALAGEVRAGHGTVTLFGRRYALDRAHVVMNGRTPPNPRLDVRLSHNFGACTFFVDLVGSVDKPKIVLSAQPDIYDDKQLFAFLFGASPDGNRYDKHPAQQGLDLAAWLLMEQVRPRLKQALPFDTLAFDFGEGTDSGQANVTLGKWLTDRLFLAYAYHHGAGRDENTSEGLLRYRFFKSWLLEMVFGDRGNGGADVLWTKQW